MDIDTEIQKISGKLAKAHDGISRQRKLLNDPAYQAKVGHDVQDLERKRLKDLETEAAAYQGTLEQFERLKVE